ncbi:MAG: DUF1489 domain-containing protein [Pseudomonadota bacterium]
MDKHVHILKLCVGAERVEDLAAWQAQARAKGPDGRPRHITRMWPKREAEVVNGGSLYWVIKGVVLVRQEIVRFDEYISADGIRRCALVLNPNIYRTEAMPRRAFQGWRYLEPEDAPRDLPKARASERALPHGLELALAEIGLV